MTDLVMAHDDHPQTPGTSDGGGAMFDRIAKRYDLLNRVMSLGLDRSWRKALVRALDCDVAAHVLDLATGTADVAIAIAEQYKRARVVGLDPSTKMLERGRHKLEAHHLSDRVKLVEGDAQALPFEDNQFDATCISFGIRNVPDRMQALREMVRVTQPGGRVVVLELGEPRGGPLAQMARFHVHHVVPRLGALLSGAPEYRYLERSIAAFPPPEEFARMMRDAGLHVRVRPLSFGAAHLYIGEVPR